MIFKNSDSADLKTMVIEDEIASCENIQELVEIIFPLLLSQQEQWKRKINDIMTEMNVNQSEMARRCGIKNRATVSAWCKGNSIPKREMFVRIGLAAGYDRDEMDRLITRYGRFPGLYAKSLEDCVCIFVIENYPVEERIEAYDYILQRIRNDIISEGAEDKGYLETVIFEKKLSEVKNVNELEQFISDNAALFAQAYNGLYADIIADIEANYYGELDSYVDPSKRSRDFYNEDNALGDRRSVNINELAELQGWSSSLAQCVYLISQRKWIPTRSKIISLGLHLSMDHNQINDLLGRAHMELLCAKNVFESVIIFILESASIEGMMDPDSDDYDLDFLCRYARDMLKELKKCAGERFKELDFSEIDSFFSEVAIKEDEEDE